MQTTVAGQMQLKDFDPSSLASDGSCLGASHVLDALSVGAFKLKAGGSAGVRGGGSVPGAGSGIGAA